jgi:exodeoxyribonuclease VII large subunit
MSKEIPTLADLRRKAPRRRTSASPSNSSNDMTGSLFDSAPDALAPSEIQPPERAVGSVSQPLPLTATEVAVTPTTAVSDRVYTVGTLIATLRTQVEEKFSQITVEGEISNWRPAASGHCYFTLKDGAAQLSIVMFRRQAQLMRFRPKDGDAVRVRGQLSVYDARGQLQLIAEWMQQTGLGAQLAAVQELKERLRREGLFERHRPLPPFPRCIGVVTSLQGAALRDIVKVCRRRHAAVRLLIYPAAVQGPRCAVEVARGVEFFSRHAELADVVIVARGGGSWEDLHGFDDERVVRAIAASTVPVITGVGHATDSVLADAAADLCAPTPSAAAELVTAAQQGLEDRLHRLHARLERAGRYELLRAFQRLDRLSVDYVLRRTVDALHRRAQRVDDLTERNHAAYAAQLQRSSKRLAWLDTQLHRSNPSLRLAGDRRRLDELTAGLRTAHLPVLQTARGRLLRATAQLDALSPLRVLARGYALVYGPGGRLVRDAADAPADTQITAKFSSSQIEARVLPRP